MITLMLLTAVLAPVVATLAAMLAGSEQRRAERAARSCIASMALSFVLSVVVVGAAAAADGGVPSGLADLPDALMVGVDRVAAVLLAAATGIGLVVASFSRRSLDAGHQRTAGYFLGLAGVAAGSALVILPGGPIPLVVGWIVSGRALVHLAGGWIDRADARVAHRRMNLTMLVSDVALVAGVGVAVALAGTTAVLGSPAAIAELEADTVAGISGQVVVAALLLVAGAARSSLFPFHRWLTATLCAPTPVSALVHAGFVTGAGLLLIRFTPIFSGAEFVVAAAIVVATVSIVIGSAASLTRPDAKGALAWSTVAQMAFMVLQVAIGAVAGAVVHIVGHGMYKAAQFLGVGDTVAAKLRGRRAPVVAEPLSGPARAAVTAVVATVAVAIGVRLGPDGLAGDERLLLVAFAWSAVAAGVYGLLGTHGLGRVGAVTVASGSALVAGVAYFVGIDLAKRFLEPSVPSSGVAADGAVVVVIAVLVVLAASIMLPGAAGAAWRGRARSLVDRLAAVRTPLDLDGVVADGAPARSTVTNGHDDHSDRHDDDARVGAAELRAKVARAAELVAPSWPLTSFVAVNPLGGLEYRTFDDATAEARRWTRGRSHRSLAGFRDDHARGLTSPGDLDHVVHDLALVACSQPPIPMTDGDIPASEVVLADLLHGPEPVVSVEPRTEIERRLGIDAADALGIDDLVSQWLAAHVVAPTWPLAPPGSSLIAVARGELMRHARRRLGAEAVAWLDSLDDDPADVLAASLEAAGVRAAAQLDEIRGHLVNLAGWAGVARWRTEWAHTDEATPMLRPIEIAATRAMVEAAVLVSIDANAGAASAVAASAVAASELPDDALPARVAVVVERLGLPDDAATTEAVEGILALVPDSMRPSIWLRAQERHFEQQMLGELEHAAASDDTRRPRPDAQVVLCIDVRSEGLRRYLEAQGRDETFGFAGFFGVPMSVRELGWSGPEARCPVLVSPSATAVEEPLVDHIGDAAKLIRRAGLGGAIASAHAEMKHVPGAAFSAAETLGWLSGPRAAWRTLTRPQFELHAPEPDTIVRIDAGVGIEQRIFTAESVLRTMGLTSGFADLVVLSGHTSGTVNNAHATALECGACAGASGAANARAVASLLNESDVRTGLAERGIEIPDATWFVGAVHDTATDSVTILDRHVSPSSHQIAIDELQQRLDRAGELQAAARAAALPGAADAADVRTRGRDWAQVRPEWGLARNAAFVIAPRDVTDAVDLGGRAFLHSYDASADPEGSVLEAIMTAPLVVGHWISSQYYFSTVDPETFGAGDKLLHNPVGGLGVVSGAGGDLRVGLPEQSTHADGAAHHQPLRLLAVVQAEIPVVERIIARNEVLSRLVNGSWLRIAARSGPGSRWSLRSAGGTWSELPAGMLRADDAAATNEHRGGHGDGATTDAVRDDHVEVG